MAFSDESILSPDGDKPGIPLKKKTLVIFVGLALAALVVSTFVMSSGDSQQVQNVPTKNDEPLVRVGNEAQIDQEVEKADALHAEVKLADGPTAQQADQDGSQPVPLAVGGRSPIPASVRRGNNTAAVFDQQKPPVEPKMPSQYAAPEPSNAASDEAQRRLEKEAQGRIAKSVVSDFSSESQYAATANAPTGNTPAGLPDLGTLLGNRQSAAPSESVKPQLDATLAALKASQTADASSKSWLKEYSGESKAGREVTRSYQTEQNYIVHQGSVISAVLGRKLNSDLPGEVTAYTTSNVYDSLGKGQLLIPKGTKLIGAYDSDIKTGQSRILFAFQRMILPNGVSMDLPAAKGSDLSGAAGVDGDVNNHFFKMFASSFVIAWLADKTQQPTNVTNIGTSGASTAAGQVLTEVGSSILERNRTIQPTITVEQGTRINVQVVRDMVFPGVYRKN